MIRTLTKPLLKERTTAHALKPITHPTRPSSGCSRRISHAPSTLISRQPFLICLSTARIANARYSVSPNPTGVKTKGNVPLPPAVTPPRKPRVDLRPAPKIPNQETRNAGLPRRPPPPVTQTSQAPSTAPSSTSGSPISESFKALQHDISEATKHGVLAPPPEGVSLVGKYWHKFKQLFWFYWDGIKLIFVTHRRQAGTIRQRVKEARARGEDGAMTRWETRFLRTYRWDLVKLLPFVLTIMILEEALPLIVLYLPRVLPSTCLLASQRERIESKRRAKQVTHVAMAKAELQQLRHYDISLVKEKGLDSLTENLTRAVTGILARSTWGPLFLQRRRITSYLAYLSADDALLLKEDMGSRLKEDELVEALEERGFILESLTPRHMREKLQWWLKGANDDKARLGLVLQAANDSKVH